MSRWVSAIADSKSPPPRAPPQTHRLAASPQSACFANRPTDWWAREFHCQPLATANCQTDCWPPSPPIARPARLQFCPKFLLFFNGLLAYYVYIFEKKRQKQALAKIEKPNFFRPMARPQHGFPRRPRHRLRQSHGHEPTCPPPPRCRACR